MLSKKSVVIKVIYAFFQLLILFRNVFVFFVEGGGEQFSFQTFIPLIRVLDLFRFQHLKNFIYNNIFVQYSSINAALSSKFQSLSYLFHKEFGAF